MNQLLIFTMRVLFTYFILGQDKSEKHSIKVENVYPRNIKHSTDIEDMVKYNII
jgi:hypothetical protein